MGARRHLVLKTAKTGTLGYRFFIWRYPADAASPFAPLHAHAAVLHRPEPLPPVWQRQPLCDGTGTRNRAATAAVLVSGSKDSGRRAGTYPGTAAQQGLCVCAVRHTAGRHACTLTYGRRPRQQGPQVTPVSGSTPAPAPQPHRACLHGRLSPPGTGFGDGRELCSRHRPHHPGKGGLRCQSPTETARAS